MPRRELKPRLELDAKGRILIPKMIREEMKMKKGTLLEAELYGLDKILLTVLSK